MKKYFYVVECVKTKKENNEIVIEDTYSEKLFDCYEDARAYYEEVVSEETNKNVVYLLNKVEEVEENKTFYVYEFNNKLYDYVDQLDCSFKSDRSWT